MVYGRASEKFYLAVNLLASSRLPIKQRLIEAFRDQLSSLQLDQLPEDVRDEFELVFNHVTKEPDRTGNIGTIAATINTFSEEEASEIASKVVSMFMRVEKAFNNRRP
jgi:hypothetical protein